MNIERLRAVKQKILDEPENFSMEDWECGTTKCIGGWACFLFPKEATNRFYYQNVSRILELTLPQVDSLCHEVYWPSEFRDQKSDPAKIAAARIERFIETNGEE